MVGLPRLLLEGGVHWIGISTVGNGIPPTGRYCGGRPRGEVVFTWDPPPSGDCCRPGHVPPPDPFRRGHRLPVGQSVPGAADLQLHAGVLDVLRGALPGQGLAATCILGPSARPGPHARPLRWSSPTTPPWRPPFGPRRCTAQRSSPCRMRWRRAVPRRRWARPSWCVGCSSCH